MTFEDHRPRAPLPTRTHPTAHCRLTSLGQRLLRYHSLHCLDQLPQILTLVLQPSVQNLDHQIWRNVSESWSIYANQTQVNITRNLTTFGAYKDTIYKSLFVLALASPFLALANSVAGRSHTAGHFGTGGDMGHPMASPNGQVFYLSLAQFLLTARCRSTVLHAPHVSERKPSSGVGCAADPIDCR